LLYIMYGEDDFSIHEALTVLKRDLGEEEMLATNTTVLAGGGITPEQLMNTCNTIPFLAEKRLVIVEGLLNLFEQGDKKTKRSSKSKNSGWSLLTESIPQMPESTVLVLIDGKLKQNNPLLVELAPQATVKRFNLLNEDKLRNWIRARIQAAGGQISPDAVRLLARLIGGNLWLLSNEIDKLYLYTMGRAIEKKDIEELVSEAREFTVFDMVDAILEGHADKAMKLLHRLEFEGAAPPYLLFMITRQFRMIIQAKDLLQQKYKADYIGRTLGISRAFDALAKTLTEARGYPESRLKNIFHILLDTDISIKTGRFRGDKGELALDLLISELCSDSI